MAFMDWSEELTLGIPKLDERHRWLADGINALHDEASRPAPDRPVLGRIFESLVEYITNHFVVEADLLKRHGIEHSRTHLTEHHAFTNKIVSLLDQFLAGGVELDHGTTPLLRDWLMHHILVLDRYYVPFLRLKA